MENIIARLIARDATITQYLISQNPFPNRHAALAKLSRFRRNGTTSAKYHRVRRDVNPSARPTARQIRRDFNKRMIACRCV